MPDIDLPHLRVYNEDLKDDTVLKRPITVTVAPTAHAKYWKPRPTTIKNLITDCVHHTEGKKDGDAMVLGDCVPGPRSARSVKAIYAIGLDYDSGIPRERLEAALLRLGYLSVIHTTYSHGKTTTDLLKDAILRWRNQNAAGCDIDNDLIRRFAADRYEPHVVATMAIESEDHGPNGIVIKVSHAPIEKHRAIVFLDRPYVVQDQPGTQQQAIDRWPLFVRAFSEQVGLPHDRAAEDIARTFYSPRHPKGGDYYATIIGGKLLDLETLDVADQPTSAQRFGPSTDAGRALIPWSKRRGHGFLPIAALEDYAPERLRKQIPLGQVMECPHDHLHSNAGDPDDGACFVMDAGAGSQTDGFTIRCKHGSCAGFNRLDHLAAMIEQGWLPDDVLYDEAYNAVEMEAAVRSEKAISPAELTPKSSAVEIEAAIRFVLSAGCKKLDEQRQFDLIKKTARVSAKDLKNAVAEVRAEMEAATRRKPVELTREAADIALAFPPPSSETAVYKYRQYEGRWWLYRERGEGEGDERLFTAWSITAGTKAVDEGDKRGIRIAYRDEDGEDGTLNVQAADAFQGYGATLKIRLREAGVCMTEAGERLAVELVKQVAPANAIEIFSRPGWRGPGLFLTAWGSSSHTNREVEIADGVAPRGEETVGTLEAWVDAMDTAWRTQCYPFKIAPLVPLAGTLIDLCEQDSVWVALTSKSSKGKTTSAEIMASIMGSPHPREGLLGPVSGTDNAFEVRFLQGSGTGYAFDETSVIAGDKLQLLIFKGTGGAGNDRLNRSAQLRQSRLWRGCYMLTGEHGLLRKIRSSGVSTTTGVGARVLEIDVEESPQLSIETMAQIEAYKSNYGHACKRFVRTLIDSGRHLDPDGIWTRVERKAVTLAGEGASAAVLRAARIAACLWEAGEIAQEAGLIPEDQSLPADGTLPEVIQFVWKKAEESDLAPASSDDLAVRTLFEALLRNRGGRVHEGTISRTAATKEKPEAVVLDLYGGRNGTAEAWRLEAWGDAKEEVYVVPWEALSRLAGGALNDKALAKLLRKRKLLRLYERSDEDRTAWDYIPGLGQIKAVIIPASFVEGDPEELAQAA